MFFKIIDALRESWPALKLNYNKMTTTEQHTGLENGSLCMRNKSGQYKPGYQFI